MWIEGIKLLNIRSFENLDIKLSRRINILVGANNSGKSTILHASGSIQDPRLINATDMRKGQKEGYVELILNGDFKKYFPSVSGNIVRYNIAKKND